MDTGLVLNPDPQLSATAELTGTLSRATAEILQVFTHSMLTVQKTDKERRNDTVHHGKPGDFIIILSKRCMMCRG